MHSELYDLCRYYNYYVYLTFEDYLISDLYNPCLYRIILFQICMTPACTGLSYFRSVWPLSVQDYLISDLYDPRLYRIILFQIYMTIVCTGLFYFRSA